MAENDRFSSRCDARYLSPWLFFPLQVLVLIPGPCADKLPHQCLCVIHKSSLECLLETRPFLQIFPRRIRSLSPSFQPKWIDRAWLDFAALGFSMAREDDGPNYLDSPCRFTSSVSQRAAAHHLRFCPRAPTPLLTSKPRLPT